MAYTPNPELVCAKAMRGCRVKNMAMEVILKKPKEYYIRLAKKLGHVSVLEHAVFTFSVEGISRACSHQLVRHRIASYSQQSQRAVNPVHGDWFVKPPSIWSNDNLREKYRAQMETIAKAYKTMLESGVTKEDARFLLPNACKTNIVITMNARELLHFFSLRLSEFAQWEIRLMAKGMLMEVKKVAPTIFEDVEYVDYEKDYK